MTTMEVLLSSAGDAPAARVAVTGALCASSARRDAGVATATADVLRPASTGRRFASFVLDAICCLFICAILLAACSVTIGDAWLDSLDGWTKRLLGLLTYFLYYLSFEARWAWTPGKLATRTRVRRIDGARPTFAQILKRSLIRMVPFEPMSWLGRRPLGWHDRWSATRVFALKRDIAPAAVVRSAPLEALTASPVPGIAS